MKNVLNLLLVAFFLVTMVSCDSNDDSKVEVENKGIVFTNTELETLVRDFLEKPTGIINEEDLLTIDALEAGTVLASLSEVDKLKNLVYLNIAENEFIKENDVAELKVALPNCTIIHQKYILYKSEYFLLKTITVNQTQTDNAEFEYEIIINGNEGVEIEVNVYSTALSLVEATMVASVYTPATNFENQTFHKYWSTISINDILATDFAEAIVEELTINALSTGAFTLSANGSNDDLKIAYHTDSMTY